MLVQIQLFPLMFYTLTVNYGEHSRAYFMLTQNEALEIQREILLNSPYAEVFIKENPEVTEEELH
jgi:Na+-transporting NADH:ubiquinone oxidoreductase subunit NqrB